MNRSNNPNYTVRSKHTIKVDNSYKGAKKELIVNDQLIEAKETFFSNNVTCDNVSCSFVAALKNSRLKNQNKQPAEFGF